MKAHQVEFSVRMMCRVLRVSSAGYYAWCKRERREHACHDAELLERIKQVHEDSRGTYGMPRIHRQLRAEGTQVEAKRVARLMKQANLRGVSPSVI